MWYDCIYVYSIDIERILCNFNEKVEILNRLMFSLNLDSYYFARNPSSKNIMSASKCPLCYICGGSHYTSACSSAPPKCKYCGKTNHASKDCWYKPKKCKYCGKTNHASKDCRHKPSRASHGTRPPVGQRPARAQPSAAVVVKRQVFMGQTSGGTPVLVQATSTSSAGAGAWVSAPPAYAVGSFGVAGHGGSVSGGGFGGYTGGTVTCRTCGRGSDVVRRGQLCLHCQKDFLP
jgi:hypothetical protein